MVRQNRFTVSDCHAGNHPPTGMSPVIFCLLLLVYPSRTFCLPDQSLADCLKREESKSTTAAALRAGAGSAGIGLFIISASLNFSLPSMVRRDQEGGEAMPVDPAHRPRPLPQVGPLPQLHLRLRPGVRCHQSLLSAGGATQQSNNQENLY